MRPPFAALALVLFVVVAGCGSEPPRVDLVLPRSVPAGERTVVRITGSGFHWRYDAVTGEATGAFRASAGDIALEDVSWIDATELEATVPATLPVGEHTVTVQGPTGTGAREAALEVKSP